MALQTAERVGEGARVVSMPCMELFRQQSDSYKQTVLPPSCRNRIAIEAGSRQSWFEFVGVDGQVIGLDHFGASAPEAELKQHFHFTPEACYEAIKNQGNK